MVATLWEQGIQKASWRLSSLSGTLMPQREVAGFLGTWLILFQKNKSMINQILTDLGA